jgi:hypothetical protein
MDWSECEVGNNRRPVHGNNYTPPWRMSQKQDAKYLFDLVGLNSHSLLVGAHALVLGVRCVNYSWIPQHCPVFTIRYVLYYSYVFYFH